MKSTLIATSAVLSLWLAFDKNNLIEKILFTAAGAFAIQSDIWIPYLKRQFEMAAYGEKQLHQWNTCYHLFSESEEARALSKTSLCNFSNNHYESNKVQWDAADQFRGPVRPAARSVIKEIVNEFVRNDSKILEVGSNKLNKEQLSHLAELLPPERLKHLTYSDYIKSVVKEESAKTKRSYQLLDLRAPAPNFYNTHDCIMAINVADVVSYPDLSKIAAGAYRILKNNGTAIFLADRPIMLSPLSDKLSNATDFAFPWTENSNFSIKPPIMKGMKVCSQDALRNGIANYDKEYKLFFENVLKFTPAQRQRFLVNSFFRHLDLCNFLQLITKGKCQTYDNQESYQNEVKSAFESNQFDNGFLRHYGWLCAKRVS